mmetsp:Transcript_43479/g.84956  ORF Transcript_43479/g.84956 Transcript_43479/m.84956 type:complete len:419 (+) Transcript_43479:57-1313(+)
MATEGIEPAILFEFQRIDTNGDGVLTPDELFEGLMGRMEQDEMQDLFGRLDTDGDGKISLEEFAKGWSAGMGLGNSQSPPKDAAAEAAPPADAPSDPPADAAPAPAAEGGGGLSAATRSKIGMPMVGFGCYQLSQEQAESSVCEALKAGFRHIDSAEAYANEEGVGKGIKASGVDRKDIYVTTKVMPGYTGWGMEEKGFDATISACKASLEKLQLDYCDLYLIHGPLASTRVEQWKALIELKRLGLAKHIGVSNYNEKHFQEIADAGLEMPEANQVEFHPLCQYKELTKYMDDKGITRIAYSSLATLSTWRTGEGQGGEKSAHLKEEVQKVQKEVSERLGMDEAKLLLRWGMQRGYAVLTKSCNTERIKSNFDVFGVSVPEADVEIINGLDKGTAVAWSANGINVMEVDVPLAAAAVA